MKVQFRCAKCNKRLFDFSELKGKIEIKCPRCGEMNSVSSGISGEIKGEFVIND